MKSLIILISCLVFVSCKKDKLKNEKEVFIGGWVWSHSEATLEVCSGDPKYDVVLTPSSEGVNYQLNFEKKGKVCFYKDDVSIDSDRIVFKVFGPEYYACALDYNGFEIRLDNYEGTEVINIMGGCIKLDTLIIHNGFPYYNDGCSFYTNYFVRK